MIMRTALLFYTGAALFAERGMVHGFTTTRPSSTHNRILPSQSSTTASSTTTTSSQYSTTSLFVMSKSRSSSNRYGANRYGQHQDARSKRQERVGQLVRSELSRILYTGNIKGNVDDILEDELRQRISIVSADVSPDLRQARITVSIRDAAAGGQQMYEDDDDDDEQEQALMPSSQVLDKRRAYSWLVRNTKPLRYSLAQKMSHMKTCPNLSFAQVDVAAAVDVMYLIDKVSAGAKRESLDVFDVGPKGVIEGVDFDDHSDDEDEDDGWIMEDGDEDDEDFF